MLWSSPRSTRPGRGRPSARPGCSIIEPALHDRDQHVRRSVGPFAIGDQLLRSYPAETLARLERWAQDPDEIVRWNVAMAFSSAAGAKLAPQGLPTLTALTRDPSRSVARAANATLRRIQKRRPDLLSA